MRLRRLLACTLAATIPASNGWASELVSPPAPTRADVVQSSELLVGVDPAAVPDAVTELAQQGIVVTRTIDEMGVLAIAAPQGPSQRVRLAAALDRQRSVQYIEANRSPRRLQFVPNDPYPLTPTPAWNTSLVNAFSAWPELPALRGPLVAVLDSGVDITHPDLAATATEPARWVLTQQFGRHRPLGTDVTDTIGHGTFVAGIIAGRINNATGVAGIGFPSRILALKITTGSGGTIDPADEAAAIRWAVARGARILNLSLGAPRDPTDETRDEFSATEQRAIEYARRKGALVVSVTGNGSARYSDYPGSLPHVLAVSAVNASGQAPRWSNQDVQHNDLAAPGVDVTSLRSKDAGGTGDISSGEDGTSFAAPHVAAAAAVVWAANPALKSDQVSRILTSSARDLGRLGHDARTGWGLLDVAAAVAKAQSGVVPAADSLEPNDGVEAQAARLAGAAPTLTATLDRYDDRHDVYALFAPVGTRLSCTAASSGNDVAVNAAVIPRGGRRIAARRSGRRSSISTVVSVRGWQHVDVTAVAGSGQYSLTCRKHGG